MDTTLFELAPLAPREGVSASTVPGDADTFIPKGVCAKMIRFVVEDHILQHVSFTGGCDGNLKAIAKLVEGMDVSEIVEKLSGITCGKKPTSCADQLCKALIEKVGTV
ncbi:TIGR03905 family TSCPD domain-containing protein [Pseudodesulfovibrio sp. JC047]|uniref:TIGR03905 family TSCPD domain-containing protein n=1 Tax=Pseudodesulfovibrio sp. JC047 TaxID=2683199 RepID=UPI0013D853D3|nr:TIGR03905 family TSCPD domain-containing protein [Pseudodesulfovibrio sp. JC047]NDV18327.1 TIGR03905 family TSCPD domain-containing protein [Pseudodesulfovibrio sp. JC047]